jgi:hypothetical protein
MIRLGVNGIREVENDKTGVKGSRRTEKRIKRKEEMKNEEERRL